MPFCDVPSHGSGSVRALRSSIENLTSVPFSRRVSGSAFMSQYHLSLSAVVAASASAGLSAFFFAVAFPAVALLELGLALLVTGGEGEGTGLVSVAEALTRDDRLGGSATAASSSVCFRLGIVRMLPRVWMSSPLLEEPQNTTTSQQCRCTVVRGRRRTGIPRRDAARLNGAMAGMVWAFPFQSLMLFHCGLHLTTLHPCVVAGAEQFPQSVCCIGRL